MKPIEILVVLVTGVLASVSSLSAANLPTLPWQREMPLREAAQSVVLESTLSPSNPQPDIFGEPFRGTAMSLNNLKMRTTLWGPPHRITVSLMKNNLENEVRPSVVGRKCWLFIGHPDAGWRTGTRHLSLVGVGPTALLRFMPEN